MAKRGISISSKLIIVSTLLLCVVIGLFGAVSSVQTRRNIDASTTRLQTQITEAMRRSGTAQLQLLAETTRIAIVQNDYMTLQAIVENLAKNDERVLVVTVANTRGTVLANSNPTKVGTKAGGALQGSLSARALKVEKGAVIDGKKAMTFAMPLEYEGGRLGVVFLAYDLAPLEAELARSETIKRAEISARIRETLIIGSFSVLVGVMLTIFQGLRISRPLRALASQADQIAGGDLHARVQIQSGDEIGLLGDRFNYMAGQVLNLMRETMVKATMEKELEVASAVQATLVPSSTLVEVLGMQLAGFFQPATQCGGDWWTYYRLGDGRVLVVIGDVTGHGVASAMVTAAAKGATSTMVAMAGGELEVGGLLKTLNLAIHDVAQGRFVMTCFASIYDPRTRILRYGNAGHNFPYVCQAASDRMIPLVVRGNRLGDVDNSEYEFHEIKVAPGDTLILYTDGIVECEDVRGTEYGDKRFRSAIRTHVAMPADQARDGIVKSATQFFGEMPQKDDITLVVGRFG